MLAHIGQRIDSLGTVGRRGVISPFALARRDEAASPSNGSAEDHIRRMRIERPQLLAAMNRIEGVLDTEHDPLGNLPKGLATLEFGDNSFTTDR